MNRTGSPTRSPRSSRTRRIAATAALGLVVAVAPAVASSVSAADAKPLKQATVSSYQRVTISATRAAVVTMKATVQASVAGSSAAPVSITMSASATRQATSSVSVAVRKSATAHGSTLTKAKNRARQLARTAARKAASDRATPRAAAAAQAKAQAAAAAAARAEAIRKATDDAKKKAAAAAPGGTATPATPATPVVTPPVVTPVASPCGGVLPTKAGGGRYTTCSFDDDFNGSSLDTSKWYAMDAQKDGFAIGDECFKPDNVSQSGGALDLTASKAAQTMTCSGSQKSYQSGLVMTKDKFSQTYGRFEIRAKFPKDAGYVSGFWMLPQNPLAGGWSDYKYGEIDVVENWALHPELKWAHLHYAETPGNYMGGTACNVTPDDNFHTYAVDWSASQMSFIYDGNTCWTTTWRPFYPYAPAGASAPAPFDQPFYMILNLSVGGSGSDADHPLSRTPMGKSMQVDYVRAWK